MNWNIVDKDASSQMDTQGIDGWVKIKDEVKPSADTSCFINNEEDEDLSSIDLQCSLNLVKMKVKDESPTNDLKDSIPIIKCEEGEKSFTTEWHDHMNLAKVDVKAELSEHDHEDSIVIKSEEVAEPSTKDCQSVLNPVKIEVVSELFAKDHGCSSHHIKDEERDNPSDMFEQDLIIKQVTSEEEEPSGTQDQIPTVSWFENNDNPFASEVPESFKEGNGRSLATAAVFLPSAGRCASEAIPKAPKKTKHLPANESHGECELENSRKAPKFTEECSLQVIEQYIKFEPFLSGLHSKATSSAKKERIWEHIAEVTNATSSVKRSWEQVRNRVYDVRKSIRQKQLQIKNDDPTKWTGPSVRTDWTPSEERLLSIMHPARLNEVGSLDFAALELLFSPGVGHQPAVPETPPVTIQHTVPEVGLCPGPEVFIPPPHDRTSITEEAVDLEKEVVLRMDTMQDRILHQQPMLDNHQEHLDSELAMIYNETPLESKSPNVAPSYCSNYLDAEENKIFSAPLDANIPLDFLNEPDHPVTAPLVRVTHRRRDFHNGRDHAAPSTRNVQPEIIQNTGEECLHGRDIGKQIEALVQVLRSTAEDRKTRNEDNSKVLRSCADTMQFMVKAVERLTETVEKGFEAVNQTLHTVLTAIQHPPTNVPTHVSVQDVGTSTENDKSPVSSHAGWPTCSPNPLNWNEECYSFNDPLPGIERQGRKRRKQ